MRGSELDFTLFYMLRPEEAPTLADTQCDRILDETNGTVHLLGDRLLLRQKQIKCRYRFQAATTHPHQNPPNGVRSDPSMRAQRRVFLL